MSEMKKHWLRILRNSAYGFLCTSILATPCAFAQQAQPQLPLPTLNEDLMTVLGIHKTQLDEGAAVGEDAKKAIREARVDIQEGVRAFQQRDGENALKELAAAVVKDPSLPPPNVMVARLCFSSNDQNVVNQGRGFLERAVISHKQTPEVFFLLGRLALTEGRLSDAELNFEKAQLFTPPKQGEVRDPELPPTAAVGWSDVRRDAFLKEVYAGRVSVCEQRGQWNEAEGHLISWIALDPNDAMAHYRKGRVLFLKEAQDESKKPKNYAEARKEFESAYTMALEQIQNTENKDELTVVLPPNLAMQQMLAGTPDNKATQEEVDELLKLVESYPNDKEKARVYSELSKWYLQQNNPTKAGELAGLAQGKDKESPAMNQLSAVMRYYANDPGALTDFTKLNSDAPDDFTASNYLALLLAESRRPEDKKKAVRLAELNVRLNPKSSEAVSTLGWAYYRDGRTPDAMQVYAALLQAAQRGEGQINADTAYYIAKVTFDSPGATERLGGIINLLRQSTSSQGPFKNRQLAQQWLDKLSGNTGDDVGSNLDTNPTRGGTPPAPVATPTPTPKPVTPPAPGGGADN
jgi:tetratricopeptide (TPR) repeat protein